MGQGGQSAFRLKCSDIVGGHLITPVTVEAPAFAPGLTIGLIEAKVHVMVFTEGKDDETVRVISLRLAEKHEVRLYHAKV